MVAGGALVTGGAVVPAVTGAVVGLTAAGGGVVGVCDDGLVGLLWVALFLTQTT